MISTSIVPSSALVMATERCQDFPFFPNQSRCVSRKLVGINFIAQSIHLAEPVMVSGYQQFRSWPHPGELNGERATSNLLCSAQRSSNHAVTPLAYQD